MVVTTTPALPEAARFAGRPPSLFAHMWPSHAQGATTTLESLSTTPARQCATTLERVHGLPWKIVLILDATLQPRASVPPENAKTFHHGQGEVIGHQWTTLGLIWGDMVMPLRPMPCSRTRECQAHRLA